MVMRSRRIEVELRFDRKTSSWAKDRQWHPSQEAVAGTPELVGWILSFGSGVRVLRPDCLREKVLEPAGEIVKGR